METPITSLRAFAIGLLTAFVLAATGNAAQATNAQFFDTYAKKRFTPKSRTTNIVAAFKGRAGCST